MNLKYLKFLVIFMGVLIVLGVIILIIGIYDKIKVSNQTNSKKQENNIIVSKPSDMELISYNILDKYIVINYENNSQVKIIILDLSIGNKIKEIDVLK